MLIEEERIINDRKFIYHISDTNKYIKQVQTGNLYIDAYDPIEYKDVRTYVETDIDIVIPPEETES